MTESGSKESPMHSTLTAILLKLGSLEATSLANRQAMTDRTELIRRELVDGIYALKEEVFPRFMRDETEYRDLAKDLDQRLRQVEIAQGVIEKPQPFISTAMRWLLKAVPISRLAAMALLALAAAVLNAMPAEMNAAFKPLLMPLLEWLRGTVS